MSLFTDGIEFEPSRRMKLDDRAAILSTLPLFAGCSRRHLRAVAKLAHPAQIEAGAVLFSEGSPSLEAYVIVAGQAEVRTRGRKVAVLGPGEIVGELGLILERPRNATVRALTPLDTLAISRRDLRAAVLETPELGWTLLEAVAHRLSP